MCTNLILCEAFMYDSCCCAAIFQGDTEMVNLAGRATGDSSQRRVPPRTEGATSFDEFMENTQREEGPRAINRINPLQTRDVENQEGKKR